MAACERRPPFEELIERAEGEASRRHEGEKPTARSQRRSAQQDLTDQDGGDEALGEVTEAVVVVTSEAEDVLNPEAEGHPRVRVVPAHDEDERMDGEQGVGQRGQGEARSGE